MSINKIVLEQNGLVVGNNQLVTSGDGVYMGNNLVVSGSVYSNNINFFQSTEIWTTQSAVPGQTINFDVLSGSIYYYTQTPNGNWTVNVRGNSNTTFNSVLTTGQSMSITLVITQGASAYYPTSLQIDGVSVTPKWQGGTAPTSGDTNSLDVYQYTIFKSAASTYTVLAAASKFA